MVFEMSIGEPMNSADAAATLQPLLDTTPRW